MLLNEFFGKPADIGKKMSKDQDDQKLGDELFWYIVDHDRLHKEFFHPLATKIKKQQDGGKVDKEKTVLEFAPMVKKGCLEFFKSKKMKGHPEKIFNKELFKDMCEKLYDHYSQDIQKDQYTLGISESTVSTPMRMQDFVKMADEIHAKMMAANHRNDADEWHRLKQEYEQLAAIAKKGMVPEEHSMEEGWQMPNAPRPTYTPGKSLPHSLQQKLDDKPNTGRAVNNKQVPIGEHLEIQMSKFIGRIIANEAIQNNKRRS